MTRAVLDFESKAYLDARDLIAGSALALAEIKNVPLATREAIVVAAIVVKRSDPREVQAFARSTDPFEHPAIIEEVNARLDELAAMSVILAFARVGRLEPMPPEQFVAFACEIVAGLPARQPGEPGYRWPSLAEWEQMAAARFGVAAPADRAMFGAMITSFSGRA